MPTLFDSAQIVEDSGGGGERGGAVPREGCGGLKLNGAHHAILLWARMPQLRGQSPAASISIAVWGLIAAISIALVSAAYY